MMKNMIVILMMLSISLSADMFDVNTDVKSKYEFDMETSQKNEKLAQTLEKFRSGEVTNEEIQLYLDKIKDSPSENFGSDVYLDKVFKQKVDENSSKESSWFSSLFSRWFFSSEDNVTKVEN